MTVFKFKSKEVIQADKEQRKAFEAEQRRIIMWLNQTPRMIEYCEKKLCLNLEGLKDKLKEPIGEMDGRKSELDNLIEALGE